MATKLPKTYAQSMRITPAAIKPLAQAAGRHRQAVPRRSRAARIRTNRL